MIIQIYLLFYIFTTVLCSPIKVVSVFRSDEIVYHKYSAVLAAIEPFRLQLQLELKSTLNPFVYNYYKLLGKLDSLRQEDGLIDSAYDRYERRVGDIVKSYGLSVESFNSLSDKINKESFLKQRILLQAYYYRIAADLETNIRPNLPILPTMNSNNNKLLRFSTISDNDSSEISSSIQSESVTTRFSKALRAIEYERLKSRKLLQDQLGIRQLPDRMCDDDVLPAMSKDIQLACKDFQYNVNNIILKHNLLIDQFYNLNKKLNNNFLFRLQINNELNRLEKENFQLINSKK